MIFPESRFPLFGIVNRTHTESGRSPSLVMDDDRMIQQWSPDRYPIPHDRIYQEPVATVSRSALSGVRARNDAQCADAFSLASSGPTLLRSQSAMTPATSRLFFSCIRKW